MHPEYPGGADEPVGMGKQAFRETNWFKLGELALDEGEEAAVPLPIEDRYSEPVSADDSKAFGLHTGKTEYVKVLTDIEPSNNVAMKTLVGEMKHSKSRMLAIGATVAAACTMFALYLI